MIILKQLRGIIGAAIGAALREIGHEILALSVSGMHAHIVALLPDDLRQMKAIIGEVKRASSRAVRTQLPGTIWAAGGDFDPIDTKKHLASAVNYVLTRQGPGAWAWSFKQTLPVVRVKVRAVK